MQPASMSLGKRARTKSSSISGASAAPQPAAAALQHRYATAPRSTRPELALYSGLEVWCDASPLSLPSPAHPQELPPEGPSVEQPPKLMLLPSRGMFRVFTVHLRARPQGEDRGQGRTERRGLGQGSVHSAHGRSRQIDASTCTRSCTEKRSSQLLFNTPRGEHLSRTRDYKLFTFARRQFHRDRLMGSRNVEIACRCCGVVTRAGLTHRDEPTQR